MGILTELIANRMLQQRQEQERQRQQQTFGSGATMMGMKPNDAAAIYQLSQGGPTGQQQAQSLMETFRQRQGQTSPQEQAQMQALQQQMTGQRMSQQQSAFQTMLEARAAPASLLAQQLSNTGQGLQNQLLQNQLQQAQNPPPVRPDPGALFKSITGSEVPANYRPTFNRTTGDVKLVPLEGSKPYQDSVNGVRTAEGALVRIQQFADDFKEYGTEQLPTSVKGRMRSNRGALMADIGRLQELGVLQPADVERLEALLPDPSEVTFVQTDAEALASIEFVEQELERSLAKYYEMTPWVSKGQVSMPGQK